MGRTFLEITRSNFGVNKPHRPNVWPALSERYKKQLRRKSFGTPLVPTLLRKGTLMNSIRIRVDNSSAIIWTDCPYAAVHQFGHGSIPVRGYFPVENGGVTGYRLTPYAEVQVLSAAEAELNRP